MLRLLIMGLVYQIQLRTVSLNHFLQPKEMPISLEWDLQL